MVYLNLGVIVMMNSTRRYSMYTLLPVLTIIAGLMSTNVEAGSVILFDTTTGQPSMYLTPSNNDTPLGYDDSYQDNNIVFKTQ
jgi:hypothetical protein